MKLVAAIEYEKIRNDEESKNKILLNKDGSFYHVYDWSAWLVCSVCCVGEGAPTPKVQRYTGKDKEYVMYGFPLQSLSKYIPEYKSVQTIEGDDLIVEVELPDADTFGTVDDMDAAYKAWRETLPVAEPKRAKGQKDITNGNSQSANLGRSGLFHIASQILSYPVESSTPAQNIEFISRLRQQIAELL